MLRQSRLGWEKKPAFERPGGQIVYGEALARRGALLEGTPPPQGKQILADYAANPENGDHSTRQADEKRQGSSCDLGCHDVLQLMFTAP